MGLENLLRIGQLKDHPPDAVEIQRLLAAAERNLADASVREVSPETRFDAAYDLPPRTLALVVEWARIHQSELLDNWRRLHADEPPRRITPLE